jgi:hypothetical protein
VVVHKYLDGCVSIRYGPHQVAEFDAGALPIRGATSKRIAAAARIPTSAGCGIRAKNALVQIKMSVLEPVQRVAGAAVIPEHGGKRPYSRCSQHTNWLCLPWRLCLQTTGIYRFRPELLWATGARHSLTIARLQKQITSDATNSSAGQRRSVVARD